MNEKQGPKKHVLALQSRGQAGASPCDAWDLGAAGCCEREAVVYRAEGGRSWSSTLPWTDCLWPPLQPWAPSVGQFGVAASTLCAQR